MKHLVVGTAGHIDHGKSSLVRALTGTDPDRLIEEQRRGITIELGFAELGLDDEHAIAFVDVPGHERFVRHMIAGATGVDAVLLVIAADQGVQPQTREHLEICKLLRLKSGLIALTKCDLVDPELLEVVELEVSELLEGSFLESSEIVKVSAKTGQGLDALKSELLALSDASQRTVQSGVPRLPIDRSFVLHGFGTIVTGTLVAGELSTGMEVAIVPGNVKTRVRGLQTHGRAVEHVGAGRRVAVNLQGVETQQAPRGATVCAPRTLQPVDRLLVRLELLDSAPEELKKGGRVRFHHGTSEIGARVRLLGEPVEGAYPAWIVLEQALPVAWADGFVLRRPAPVDTVGGGRVVDINPPRPKRAEPELFREDSLELDTALRIRIARAGAAGCSLQELSTMLGLLPGDVQPALAHGVAEGVIVELGRRWILKSQIEALAPRAIAWLENFHSQQPLESGVDRERLRAALDESLPRDLWRSLLERWESAEQVRVRGEHVALFRHRVELDPETQALLTQIEDRYRQAGLAAPELGEIADIAADPAERRTLVGLLEKRGTLVSVLEGRWVHQDALQALRSKLEVQAQADPRIDVGTFKTLAGVSRKFAIPLLEYFDRAGVTRRIGDSREITLKT